MSWSDRIRVKDVAKAKLLDSVADEKNTFFIESNSILGAHSGFLNFKFSELIGIGVRSSLTGNSEADVSKLKEWLTGTSDFVLGYFCYDTKNLTENLKSRNADSIGFPTFRFVVPEIVAFVNGDKVECFSHSKLNVKERRKEAVSAQDNRVEKSISETDYIKTVEKLREHIQHGDIYEVNYCVEHKIENVTLNPFQLYRELQQVSPAPFSCYLADSGKYLMSSSPERFMMKRGNRVVSQPMKGTNRRTKENERQKEILRNDTKEVAENVMITDLVRNDLSRSAKKGSVKVDELCGVYEFEHVNQMISTVSAELREDVHPLDALLKAFPMGSMTGAPKIKAMELIDQYEDFSRGLYSGSVGYFTPNLDFDFNVIIRSILYNEEKRIVTFPTGSAITINSEPEKEYEECMLKAEAMRKVLFNHAK